jgi:hypothetical protein
MIAAMCVGYQRKDTALILAAYNGHYRIVCHSLCCFVLHCFSVAHLYAFVIRIQQMIVDDDMKVKRLLEAGANVDARGEEDNTAIHWAAQQGKPQHAKVAVLFLLLYIPHILDHYLVIHVMLRL